MGSALFLECQTTFVRFWWLFFRRRTKYSAPSAWQAWRIPANSANARGELSACKWHGIGGDEVIVRLMFVCTLTKFPSILADSADDTHRNAPATFTSDNNEYILTKGSNTWYWLCVLQLRLVQLCAHLVTPPDNYAKLSDKLYSVFRANGHWPYARRVRIIFF